MTSVQEFAGISGVFADPALAERLMPALWPVLWLIPMIGATAAIAWRLAGREAACVALLLAVFGLPGMGQFRPGRIDHHNVQIALAALAVAATVWSDRKRLGRLGGRRGHRARARRSGSKSLPILALCGVAIGGRASCSIRPRQSRMRAYGVSLAASTRWRSWSASAPIIGWSASATSSRSIRRPPSMVGGLGLGLISFLGAAHAPWRAAPPSRRSRLRPWRSVSAFEPRCIGGPFAMMDPIVRVLWLDRISEMQSLMSMLHTQPLSGVAEASFPAVGLLATLLVARALRRDFGFLTAAAAFLLALAIMIEVNKFYAYALWLGVPLVAVAALAVSRLAQARQPRGALRRHHAGHPDDGDARRHVDRDRGRHRRGCRHRSAGSPGLREPAELLPRWRGCRSAS